MNNYQESIRALVVDLLAPAKIITNDVVLPVSKQLTDAASSIVTAFEPFASIIEESIRQLREKLEKIIRDASFPTISDERKETLLQSHAIWGAYGWTINPVSSNDKLFDSVPKDKKHADALAIRECTSESMKELFQITRKMKRVQKADFEEAVCDFDNKRYKSCALLLFSMIDSKLIRLQKQSQLNGRWREVGVGAVKKAKIRVYGGCEEKMILTLLFLENIFSCLEKVFENGNDFRKQPTVINRNYLDHGMSTRKTTRKDCIQLFILYYNILDLIDMIHAKKKPN